MEFSVLNMIEKFLREKKNRHRRLAVFLVLALVVALATTAALKLNGIAKTRTLTVLDCPAEIHEHTDGCYDGDEKLICGYADFVVHTHSLDCYFDDVLVCKLPVIEAHAHTDDCYDRVEYLVCGKLQSAEQVGEVHIHTDACYTETTLLTCGSAESGEDEGHVHTDACYTVEEELTCGLFETEETAPAHVHTDKCYKVHETLICEKEEIILHTHTAECFEEAVFDEAGTMVALTSRLSEDVTVPDTWTREMVPVCGQIQIEEHIHGAGCLYTIKLTPEEAEEYISTIVSGGTQADPDDDNSEDNNAGDTDFLKKLDEIADSITAAVQKRSGSAWVSAGEWEHFEPGDDIRIVLTYSVDAGKLQNGDVIVYRLPDVLALDHDLSSPVTQNGLSICTATVTTDGSVTILLGNNMDPAIGLDGTLTVTCRIKEDANADGSRFVLPGTDTFIAVGKKQPETSTTSDGHDLTVIKENEGFTSVEDGSGKKIITYTVTVISENGTGSDITLNDYFRTQPKDAKPLPEFGAITVTKNPGNETVEDHGLFAENGAISGTLPELGENESYTITYTVTVDPEDYDTEGGYLYLSNHADAYFNSDGHAEDDSGATVQDAQISKTGKYEDGKFVWTIWAAADNKGKTLWDIPDEELRALIEGLSADTEAPGSDTTVSVDCSDGGEHSVTLAQLLDGYEIECGGEHTFTFETDPTLNPGESVTYENNARLSGNALDDDGYNSASGSIFGSRDNWSGTKEGGECEYIGSDDGTGIAGERFTWSVTINFPDDETWTDFTYTDSFRQTMTGWILQSNGEKVWEEDHPIHHYQLLSRLDKELNDTLWFWLAQAGLENELTYTFVYKDTDGNEVVDGDAEVVYFEIRFRREAGRNLHGQSISFDYTSLVDTKDFADNNDYNIDNDFTLPDFAGMGSFRFRYNDNISEESETCRISVKNVWLDVDGSPLTDGMPDHVEMILKQYAFNGGIYLTEKPEDPEDWCELTLHIGHGAADDQHDVWIKSPNEEILGTNTVTVWIPKNSHVQLSADCTDPENAPDGSWSYSFNVKDVSGCELTITVDPGYNNVFLKVIGKAPAGFIPSGDFTRYGDTITLNGVDDDWTYTWEQLPLDDGNDTYYVYTVEESEVPDGYYVTVEDDGEGTFIVTNRKSMEPGKITVEVKWVDYEGYPLVTHPESVELELQKKVSNSSSSAESDSENDSPDDEWVTVENSTITLPNEEGEWTACWTDLEDGEYRVVEKIVNGYAVSYIYVSYDNEGNRHTNPINLSGNAGFVTVTNIEKLVEDGEIIVEKVWEYEDGTPDTGHHDSITIIIKRAKKTSSDESEPPSESETVPSEPDTSEPDTSETVPSEPDAPKTGDETNLLLYIIAAGMSGILLMALALDGFERRNPRKEKAIEEDIDE